MIGPVSLACSEFFLLVDFSGSFGLSLFFILF